MTIDIEAVRAAAGSTRDPEIRRSLGLGIYHHRDPVPATPASIAGSDAT